MNLQAKIDRIKNNLDAQSYTVAAGEAVKIIEVAFRKLLVDGLTTLSDQDRLKVMQAIIDVGKGHKGVESFGLGEILGVLRQSKFNNAWEAATGSNLSAIKMINLDALNDIRIKITHEAAEASEFEAKFLFNALEGVIQAFGILSLEKRAGVQEDIEQSNVSNNKKSGPSVATIDVKAAIYSPTEYEEEKRLSIQGTYSLDIDMQAFKHALRMLPKDNNLMALDVGCANGEITESRFGAFSVFEKVIGIDANDGVIQSAVKNSSDKIFEYHQLDIEDKGAEQQLKSLLEPHKVGGFDVIFSAFTLHFIQHPVAVLRKLRKLLNKGGVIILRGWDDETTVAYPDKEGVVTSIINEISNAPLKSDITNGRKMYNQTWKAGFRDIKILHNTTDTAAMDLDERMDFFISCFSWRRNFFSRLVKTYPNELKWREKLEWIDNALESLEVEFESEDFYYMELTTVAVGQKK